MYVDVKNIFIPQEIIEMKRQNNNHFNSRNNNNISKTVENTEHLITVARDGPSPNSNNNNIIPNKQQYEINDIKILL